MRCGATTAGTSPVTSTRRNGDTPVPEKELGHGTYSIGTYDLPKNPGASSFEPDTRDGWWKAADAWVGWFQEHAPHVQYFRYLHDEPGYSKASAGDARDRYDWLHSNAGIGRALRALCTCQITIDMEGYVDIWQFWEPIVRARTGSEGTNVDLGGFAEFIQKQQARRWGSTAAVGRTRALW